MSFTYNFVVALENTEDAIIDCLCLFKVFFKGKCLQQGRQDLILVKSKALIRQREVGGGGVESR